MEDDTVCRSVAQEELCDPSQALALLGEYSDEVVAVHKKAGRPPEISWLHFGMGVLLCFWRGWQHQRDLWRLLGWQQVGAFAPVPQTDQAIYNRLAQADVQMQALFQQVTAWLRQRLWAWQERELVPFATQVLALDESTLDQVARWLPNLRQLAQGNAQLLAGRLAGLFDVRLQQWVRVELFEEALRDSRVAAWQMIEGLATGTLLLFDRGYFSFPWLDRLTEEGYWWVGRYVKKVSYAVSHVCYEGDGVRDAIVYLGKYRSDQARYPVRLVSFWYQGQLYEYLTNVLDPHLLSMADIARLYARRWDIELAFRVLKDYLGLKALWSAKWSVVRLQIWAGLLLAQLFHALQRQVAVQAGVDPQEVSMDLLIRLTPRLAEPGVDVVERLVRSGREMGLIRPSSRVQIQTPVIDPTWVCPPPPEAIRPREKVRYRPHQTQPPPRTSQASAQARSPN